ncbi:dDENN domain protein, partial [Opisthorchis viverrini]
MPSWRELYCPNVFRRRALEFRFKFLQPGTTSFIDFRAALDPVSRCQLEYCHPPDLPNIVSEAQNLKEFVFPCNHKNTLSEEYTLIFTDADGKLDFVSCVCLPTSGYVVCLRSCPSPFVAGIHSCAVEKAKEVLNEGIRLVDLDNDVVYTSGSSEQRLPSALRQWLLRRCFSSHHAILRRKRPTQQAAAAALVSPFLEAMAILLGGYREAMTRGAKSGTFTHVLIPSSWTFDPNAFMATRGRECQAYLRELLQSQMFHQFIESRLAELNSDLGMIHQDDFEDCISRVPSHVRSNLSDLLERGRRGFGRLATR